MATTPLTVLDLVPISSGSTAGQALRHSIDLAQRAEQAGYRRYWFAEHHLNPGVAGTSPDDWDRTFSLNLRSHFMLVRRALVTLPDNGSIVFMGSVAGLRPGSRIPAYDASKAGLIGLNRHVAVEGGRVLGAVGEEHPIPLDPGGRALEERAEGRRRDEELAVGVTDELCELVATVGRVDADDHASRQRCRGEPEQVVRDVVQQHADVGWAVAVAQGFVDGTVQSSQKRRNQLGECQARDANGLGFLTHLT